VSSAGGPALRILKFGGSSLRHAAAIRRAVAVVASAGEGARGVVVSAMGGVTDALLAAARRAELRDDGYHDALETLGTRHLEAATALAEAGERVELNATLERAFADLADLLHGIYLLREASARTLDAVAGYGERLSSWIVAAALRAHGVAAEAVDARALIETDDRFGAARVDFEATRARVRRHFADADPDRVQVVPGFVGATPRGHATTLGRGGSDYTAALLAAALDAGALELWTDVDAVMTADPGLVPEARPIAHLSYVELLELCHFGAKIVFPPAVHPSRAARIPVLIRNTFRPDAPCTTVTTEAGPHPPAVRGISSIPRIALLRLEGEGMIGVPGIAGRLFGALAEHDVSVILISQASSEHSICFAVEPGAVERAVRAIEGTFALERRLGLVEPPVVEDELAIIAVVGAGMRERPGIAGAVFSTLGGLGINVRAIAQGSSELNISLVVAAADRPEAVRALHRTFIAEEEAARPPAVAGVAAAVPGTRGAAAGAGQARVARAAAGARQAREAEPGR